MPCFWNGIVEDLGGGDRRRKPMLKNCTATGNRESDRCHVNRPDLLHGQVAAFSLKAIEAIAAVSHILKAWADVTELFGKLQPAHFPPHDLLLLRSCMGCPFRWSGGRFRLGRGTRSAL